MAFGRGRGLAAGVGRVHLERGLKVALNIAYCSTNGKPHAELIWSKASNTPSPEAIAAAKGADVVIAVVGITSRHEGDEMPVSDPIIALGDYAISIGGGQPESGAPGLTGRFHIDGQYALPE